MGSIGYKTAAFLFGGIQTLRQVIEFVAQNGQLIVAAHGYLMSIVTFLNDPHGSHDPIQTAGKGVGEGN